MTNDNNHKLRAVILAAVMVFSVIAMSGIAASEITRGDSFGSGNAGYSVNDASGNVTNNGIIFQGEDDVTLRNTSGGNSVVTDSSLSRDAAAGGETLQLPVPQDQPTGTYTAENSNFSVTVASPTISTFDVNNNQTDINGGTLTSGQTGAAVNVTYNFATSENITLTVEDSNGIDVTQEFLRDSPSTPGVGSDSINGSSTNNDGVFSTSGTSATVGFDIDPAGVDQGEYTFTVEGDDDFDFGDVSQSTTVTIVTEQTASLSLDSTELSQGEDNTFTIEEGIEGNFHALTIDSNEFRSSGGSVAISSQDAANVFRSVGDTVQTGVLVNNGSVTGANDSSENLEASVDPNSIDAAFAVVEIDGGTGVGSVETQFLDDTQATVDLFPADGLASNSYLRSNNTVRDADAPTLLNGSLSTDDEADFNINEGSVSIESPSTRYVVNSEVDLTGETSPGVDEVVFYARDQGGYELVEIDGQDTVTVDADNTFSEESVVLSDLGGNLGGSILSIPGNYRLGAIDAQSVREINNSDQISEQLDTSEFNSGVSTSQAIIVTDTSLTGNFTTYNGQIADEIDDNIDVQGVAVGKSGSGISVVFVGPRGTATAEEISVDADGTFDTDDISLQPLAQGTVSGHIISSGRDGGFGDGFAGSVSEFNNEVENNFSGTADQVRSQIVANSIDDTASDDIQVVETFRLADGLTTLESVTSPVESNGTIEIEGQTNVQPNDNTITLELLDENNNIVETTSTDQWGTDGVYTTSLTAEDVEPGNYTLEVDDGSNTDRVSVQVVEQVQETPEPTPEPTATEEPTPTATPEPTATEEPTPEPTPEPTATPTSTPTGTPGFGIVVALIALVAAALLAVRRNN